jgi:hypothetical protein
VPTGGCGSVTLQLQRYTWGNCHALNPDPCRTRAQEYVDQVIYLADQADYHRSLELLRSQLVQLEQAAATELSGTDLEAVYATSSVAISSAEYWPANAQYWAALCGTDITCYPGGGGGGGMEPPLEPMANRNVETLTRHGPSPTHSAGGSVNQMVNGWKVLGADCAGALGGFLMAGWPGAVVNGGVASTIAVIMMM